MPDSDHAHANASRSNADPLLHRRSGAVLRLIAPRRSGSPVPLHGSKSPDGAPAPDGHLTSLIYRAADAGETTQAAAAVRAGSRNPRANGVPPRFAPATQRRN